MKFSYTILYVKDVAKTASFYQQAFQFTLKMITPEQDYAELVSGETTLSFASLELANSNIKGGVLNRLSIHEKPFAMQLSFTSEQIEIDFEHALNSGARLLSPLITKPWGQTVGYVQDINGFLIEICTPIITS